MTSMQGIESLLASEGDDETRLFEAAAVATWSSETSGSGLCCRFRLELPLTAVGDKVVVAVESSSDGDALVVVVDSEAVLAQFSLDL